MGEELDGRAPRVHPVPGGGLGRLEFGWVRHELRKRAGRSDLACPARILPGFDTFTPAPGSRRSPRREPALGKLQPHLVEHVDREADLAQADTYEEEGASA